MGVSFKCHLLNDFYKYDISLLFHSLPFANYAFHPSTSTIIIDVIHYYQLPIFTSYIIVAVNYRSQISPLLISTNKYK